MLDDKIELLQAQTSIAEKQKICFEIIDDLLSELTGCKPVETKNSGYVRVDIQDYWYLKEPWCDKTPENSESLANSLGSVADAFDPMFYGAKKENVIAVYKSQDEIPAFTIPFAVNALKVYVPAQDDLFGKYYDLREFCKSAKGILNPAK